MSQGLISPSGPALSWAPCRKLCLQLYLEAAAPCGVWNSEPCRGTLVCAGAASTEGFRASVLAPVGFCKL